MASCHYNFASLELYHYYSSIWKHAITISPLLSSCHFLHFRRCWAHLQTVVYVFRCRMAQYAPGSSDKIEPGAQSRPPPLWQSAYTRPAGLVRSRCEILAVIGSREPPQHWLRQRAPLPACGRADTRPALHGETAAREGAAQGHAGRLATRAPQRRPGRRGGASFPVAWRAIEWVIGLGGSRSSWGSVLGVERQRGSVEGAHQCWG